MSQLAEPNSNAAPRTPEMAAAAMNEQSAMDAQEQPTVTPEPDDDTEEASWVMAAFKAGWKAAGKTDEEIAAMDLETLVLGPMASGGHLIGHVEQIHGRGAEQKSALISKEEAEVIARYWMKDILAADFENRVYQQGSSRGSRMRAYGYQRIRALIDAGLLTKAQMEDVREAARKEAGYPPFEEWEPIERPSEDEPEQAPSETDPAPVASQTPLGKQVHTARHTLLQMIRGDMQPAARQMVAVNICEEPERPPASVSVLTRAEVHILTRHWVKAIREANTELRQHSQVLEVQTDVWGLDRIGTYMDNGLIDQGQLQRLIEEVRKESAATSL